MRHFLIEPTSKGVKLKGYRFGLLRQLLVNILIYFHSNEPVFASLSALIYQHTLINI